MKKIVSSYINPSEFEYLHSIDTSPDTSDFILHNHNDNYEIVMFIRGNSVFHVEGTVYAMTPYDIVTARSDEMHIMAHNLPCTTYDRIVINIKEDFFIKNNCEDFKEIFTKRPLGTDNLISAELVLKHNIQQLFLDMDKYIESESKNTHIILRCKLIEILYNLNLLATKSNTSRAYDERIKDIVLYINNNLASDLSLDNIANHFFQSKYHICHVFKKHTGMTITQYIIYKRLLRARELHLKGKTLIDASMEAGFGSYSTFYKLYTREMGQSPSKDFKNK